MGEMLRGLNLLVVEDDYLIQLDLQTMLENAGATVVTASSVREAVSKMQDDYHVAILDIRLPDGEVLPVAESLAARRTPIIFHSGNDETTRWARGFPDAIAVSKPVAENVLIDTVRRHSGIADRVQS